MRVCDCLCVWSTVFTETVGVTDYPGELGSTLSTAASGTGSIGVQGKN